METYQTAKVALQDSEGNLLLLRRSSTHPKEALKMDLPGGVVDPGEQPAEAVIREVKEETGLDVNTTKLQLFYADTEKYHDKNAVRLVYLVKLESKPNVSISWEHDSYDWLPLPEAIEALPEGRYTRRALQHIKDNNLNF